MLLAVAAVDGRLGRWIVEGVEVSPEYFVQGRLWQVNIGGDQDYREEMHQTDLISSAQSSFPPLVFTFDILL